MDKRWRPAQRDGSKPFKKGGGRPRPSGPVSPSTAAEDLAEYVLTTLARGPENLKIDRESPHPAHHRILVTCDSQVTGRLIGKGGKTITALRELVGVAAERRGKRIDIEVSSQQ